MTEADKDLLRQYEGAGGLGEDGASTHGTLYEFYTPRTVAKKVWQIVDKYIPGAKTVLEPSAGIGRFAEDRPNDKFTLNEFDNISSRIAGILHPEAENKHGAFQEFFKPGKPYAGKKYDVVIGNPPYGSYEGLWKGKGEGEDHTHYEEYFIDRGLDTLREGGVMAFVVPSSFLRNGDSKIKQKIAVKGKLMEAWRLPNGTFNSTGVGTDIIVIRKEKGDPAQLSNNAYFDDNPGMVMGVETTRNGRYGEEKYVGLEAGETFDEAIDRINAEEIEAAPLGVPAEKEKLNEEVEIKNGKSRSEAMMGNKNAKKNIIETIRSNGVAITPQKGKYLFATGPADDGYFIINGNLDYNTYDEIMAEAEKQGLKPPYHVYGEFEVYQDKKNVDFHKLSETLREYKEEKNINRSDAMRSNKNAAWAHKLDTAAEFNAKYNKHVAPEALPVWKAAQWDGSIDFSQLDEKSKNYIQKSGNYIKSAADKWYDIVNFASGNIYDKLDQLERDKEILSKAEYEKQKNILVSALPKPKTITEFEISPLGALAESFITSETWTYGDAFASSGKKRTRDAYHEAMELDGSRMTLTEAFKNWIRQSSRDDLALPPDASKEDIISYVDKKRVTTAKARDEEEKEANRIEAQRKITARREAGERLFNQYIREQLSLEDQKRLTEEYNRRSNGTVQADYTKIPVFLEGISKKFKGEDFKANDSQMKGVSWLANQGNGIVAFDVGVGKALWIEEEVATPEGWRKIGDIKAGDYVFAVDGTPTRVLGVYPQGMRNLFRITFSDKESVLADGDHLWDVQYPYQRNKAQCYGNKSDIWTALTSKEIYEDMNKSTRRNRKYTIPMCKPVQYEKRNLTIHPYLMGYAIGNGCIGQKHVSITIPDKYTIDKITALLPEGSCLAHADKYDYRFNGTTKQHFKDYGLTGKHSFDKFIPEDYMYSSVEDRIALLRGLMDSDGTVGGESASTPIYYTTSKELACNVKELVQSLGGTVKIHEKQGKYKKDNEVVMCRLCYSLSIRLKGINPFELPRKADKYIEHTKYFPVRFIESIEEEGCGEAVCIMVEHEKHEYLLHNYIVTHNTITAIMAANNDIQMGRAKRPIIGVPKSVYKNWIFEIKELFPNVKINELGNFSEIGKYKDENGKLKIDEGSISLCTYEALEKIGFTDETLNGDLKEAFIEALDATNENDSDRKKAKDEESIMTRVGKASRTGDNWVNWEDTGFDHITVDEAHNFRNSFSKPRNKNKGDADEFRDVPGGSTALRGLKLFAISQMVQKHNNGRNVHLLTATPFQNSPVEIYNMLSLVAREQLKEAGIFNFHEFLTQFAELKSEISVDSKGNIVQKNVMKGFRNLSALQNLLNQYIMKIDGDDAGIIRPDREDHIVELNPTAEQRDITEKIRAYMEAGPDLEKDPGAALRCINALRQAALSPALVDGFEFLDPIAMGMAGIRERSIRVKNKQFVEGSPKMTFVADTTVNLYKQHPDKGQIIHLPQGISHYEDVKKYLVSKGVPADAIAFVAPEYLRASDKGNDDKEEIKNAFNDPNNKIKIIIGSDTIKEGMNLNGNTIQTYPCMLDWNPTGTQQLIGRSHRQGNLQGTVHITFPLMNDSVDSFMYQKHDEKGTRLDNLWNSKKDKLDINGIDPEELKFSLIKDPKKRADLYIREKTADLKQREKIAESTSDKIFKMAGERKNYASDVEDYQKEIEKMRAALAAFNAKSDEEIIQEYDIDFSSKYSQIFYDDYASARGNNIKEIRASYTKAIKESISDAQKTAQRSKGKMETIDNTLKRYGIDDAGNMAAIERIRKRYSEEALDYKAQIEAIENNREQYIREASRRIKEETKPGISVTEAVLKNTTDVSNNLKSMEVVKEREKAKKDAGTVKKSFALLLKKRISVKVRGRI
jgi:hypothetical protein